MRLPIFIVGAGVRAFHSVEAAEAFLEPADARSGQYVAFDSLGLHLRFKIVPKKVRVAFGLFSTRIDHVELGPGEDTPTGQERLRELLRVFLEDVGGAPEWIHRLSDDALVREVTARSSV